MKLPLKKVRTMMNALAAALIVLVLLFGIMAESRAAEIWIWIFIGLVAVLTLGVAAVSLTLWRCPVCGGHLGRDVPHYCPHCGEKLDL